jgi:hypothetical protein
VRASGGFYRWRHGGEFARLLIFDQIIAFDGIAAGVGQRARSQTRRLANPGWLCGGNQHSLRSPFADGLNQPRTHARCAARRAFRRALALCCLSQAAITRHASQRFRLRDLVV